jgi:hypothetical protein
LVQTKAEYLDHWEVPAIDSWHARFFSWAQISHLFDIPV